MKQINRSDASPRPLLKWVLAQGEELLTCNVERSGDQYRVSVLPSAFEQAPVIRTFDAAVTAFERHAQLVSDLRGIGWTLVAYK